MIQSEQEISRRELLRKGAAGAAIGAVALAAPGLASADVSHGSEQIGEIYQLQAGFHWAKSHQDIDMMMSLWAADSWFIFNGQTYYNANGDVRTFFLNSGSWKHHRMSLVPSFKDRIEVHGNTAFLYFECHDIALDADDPGGAPRGARDSPHQLRDDPQRRQQLAVLADALRLRLARLSRHHLRHLRHQATRGRGDAGMRTHLMLRGRRRTVRLIARSSRNCATRPEPKPLAWASVHECALSTRQLQSSRNCQPTARSTISNPISRYASMTAEQSPQESSSMRPAPRSAQAPSSSRV